MSESAYGSRFTSALLVDVVRDLEERGVEWRAVDLNTSSY
jgi:hypothetical protein